jgi:hypothetical protein
MDPGVPGVESKADGGLAPEIRENRRKAAFLPKKRIIYATNGPWRPTECPVRG